MEFKDLLAGLGPETALGRVVSIRSEDDKEVLKNFTPDMRRIRSEWAAKSASHKSERETASFLENMKQALISMAGGITRNETESEVSVLRAQAEDTLQPGGSEPGSVCALPGEAVQEDIRDQTRKQRGQVVPCVDAPE